MENMYNEGNTMPGPELDAKPAQGTPVTLTEAGKRFGELVTRAAIAGETIIVSRHGIPAAAIIGMREYEALKRLAA